MWSTKQGLILGYGISIFIFYNCLTFNRENCKINQQQKTEQSPISKSSWPAFGNGSADCPMSVTSLELQQ